MLTVGMLTHQIEFSKAIQEIYKPISGRASDPDSVKPEGSLEGIKACEEYEAVVGELQETLRPELEVIETRIIQFLYQYNHDLALSYIYINAANSSTSSYNSRTGK